MAEVNRIEMSKKIFVPNEKEVARGWKTAFLEASQFVPSSGSMNKSGRLNGWGMYHAKLGCYLHNLSERME